jgi:8-oxo-dGTP diphosphatase
MVTQRNTRKEYRNKIVVGVEGIIKNPSGKICLVQRRNYPWEGYYSLPGGSIKLEETLREALEREIKEELGIEVMVRRPFGLFDAYAEDRKARFMTLAYMKELYNAKFGSEDELDELKLSPDLKSYWLYTGGECPLLLKRSLDL